MKYTYEGINKIGKNVSAKIEADSEREARTILRNQGIRVKKVHPPSLLETDLNEWMVEKGLAKAFGSKELMHFTRQMATMINAGVPILTAVELLQKTEKNPSLKKSLKVIVKDVSGGKTIAESMEKIQGFSKLYCNLIKAGEVGGILDTILDKLAIFLEKQEKIKKQIKSAMTYPAIVLTVGIGVIWGMMTFVVPKFVSMLKGNNQEIPAITQFVIDMSNAFREYTPIALPVLIFLFVFIKSAIQTKNGKIVFDEVMMKMPVFGDIIIKGNLSSFTSTMATMLGSGISLIESLEVCIDTLDNQVMARDLTKVKKSVESGQSLTAPLLKIDYFPDMVAKMIEIGEQTGAIDNMLEKVSVVFEEEVSDSVENMTKLIEPFILIFLGGFVAVILVAMYMPIFSSAGGV